MRHTCATRKGALRAAGSGETGVSCAGGAASFAVCMDIDQRPARIEATMKVVGVQIAKSCGKPV